MFVYVTDRAAKDKLLSLGFRLIRSDEKNSLWCFLNRQDVRFEFHGDCCVVSDVLRF